MPTATPGPLQRALGRATAAVGQFSLPQRVLALIGVAAVVVAAVAVGGWLSRPTMAPLFASLSTTDASAIVDQLDSEGVAYTLADGGTTVLVPADEVYRLRLAMAAAGLPAETDGEGYSLLDSLPVTASDFQQQTTYTRALEGELAETISALDGVDAASVTLALPEESVFVSERSDPTASVFVRTTRALSGEQVSAIVHLVAAGIPDMDPADVAVIDASGTVLSAIGDGVAADTAHRQTADYETRITAAVQQLLDQVVGVGRSAVTVTAELDYDSTQRTTEAYTAPEGVPPLARETTTESYTGDGGQAAGVVGAEGAATTADGEGSYESTSESVNNAVNKVTEVTTTAPGTVRRQSIAVAVDSEAAADATMDQLQAMIAAAAGIDPERGDTVSVQRMAFDTSAAEAATAALAAADEQAAAAQQTAMIRQAATAGGVLLLVVVAFLLWRRSAKARRHALDLGELAMVERGAARAGGGAAGGALTAGAPGGPALIEPADGPPDVTALKRAEITALAEDQPAEIAELLRGWLATSGRR